MTLDNGVTIIDEDAWPVSNIPDDFVPGSTIFGEDYIYFHANTWDNKNKGSIKLVQVPAGGAYSTKTGELEQSIKVDGWVDDLETQNKCMEFFASHNAASGNSVVIVIKEDTGTFVKFRSKSGMVNYMPGELMDFDREHSRKPGKTLYEVRTAINGKW